MFMRFISYSRDQNVRILINQFWNNHALCACHFNYSLHKFNKQSKHYIGDEVKVI